jgi:hypothetical protein
MSIATSSAAAKPATHGVFSVVLRNITSSWAALVVNTIISFVLAPIVVNTLGNVYYGIWTLLMQFTGYLWLFDFGVRESVIKYVAEYHASGERAKLESTVRTAISVYALVTVAALLAVTGMTAALPFVFNIPAEAVQTAQVAAFLTGATVAQSFLSNVFVGILMGLQRIYLVSRVGILFALVRAGAIYALLTAGYGLVGLSVLNLVLSLANAALVIYCCRVFLPDLPLRPARLVKAEVVKLYNYGKFVLISNIGDKIVFTTDAIVISVFLPIAALTPYAIGGTLIGHMRSVVMTMAQVFNPLTSSLRAGGDETVVQRVVESGAKSAMVVGLPLCIGFIARTVRPVVDRRGARRDRRVGADHVVARLHHRPAVLHHFGSALWAWRSSRDCGAARRRRAGEPGAEHRAGEGDRPGRRGDRHGRPAHHRRGLGAAARLAQGVPDRPAVLLRERLRSAAPRVGPVPDGHVGHSNDRAAAGSDRVLRLGRPQPDCLHRACVARRVIDQRARAAVTRRRHEPPRPTLILKERGE